MKILYTGAKGQLGYQIGKVFKGYELLATDVNESDGITKMDITDALEVKKVIGDFRPEVVIHGAAYTNVDGAESDREGAFLVNETGTRNIVQAAKEVGAKVVYVSTDYVFAGDKETGYDEDDETGPQSVYGESKLAGEKAVQEIDDFIIARTAWLYGETEATFQQGATGKTNFVETMLKLADSKSELRVIDDQIGSPTYTKDLAEALKYLVEKKVKGIFHIINSGKCSWYGFARKIFEMAHKDIKVSPIPTSEYNQPAKRPAFSVLYTEKLVGFGYKMRSWEEALKEYLENRS